MVIRHDLIIPEENPFQNCKLAREKYADILTGIATTYADGFVLVLNNKWGDGKTTFVKMWKQSLKNEEYATLYFNAWENDFNHNPMVAILSELKSLNINDQSTTQTLIKKGAQLSLNILPIVVSAIAEKYINTDKISEALQKLSDNATNLLEEQINDYANKKKGIEDFQKELEKYIQKLEKKPLIFIIDELDRCNPKYAVEVLEHIKHFFSVPGIVFVLSMDKDQLGHCIKGYFGSHEMDTEEYLRRFIDLEFSLPRPEPKAYCDYLFNYYKFHEFFDPGNTNIRSTIKVEKDDFINTTYMLFKHGGLTPRHMEKISILTRVVINSFHQNNYLFIETLLIMVYLKIIHPQTYQDIKEKKLSLQQLSNKLFSVFPHIEITDRNNRWDVIETELLFRYNVDFDDMHRSELIINNSDPKELSYKPNFLPPEKYKKAIKIIDHFSSNHRNSDIGLEYLIEKIDLREKFMP